MAKYTNDKLDSNQFVEDVFSIFENFTYKEGDTQGFTMMINGKYGSGKTTIFECIKEENTNRGGEFDIIEYNAWENNFFDNPLIPILYTLSNLRNTWTKVKDCTISVFKNLLKNGVRIFTKTLSNAHSIDLTDVSDSNNFFTEYREYLKAVNDFKKVLSNCCKEKRIILLVDELDRCLPDYQIKVLESLYHFLNVPGLIVVVAMDKEQLEHTIESYFGLDNYGYYTKFFQYTVDLPKREKKFYLMSLIEFEQWSDEYNIRGMIADILIKANISLRTCLLIINELNMLCKNIPVMTQANFITYHDAFPIFTVLVLLIKYTEPRLYAKYILNNEINSSVVIEQQINFEKTNYSKFLEDIKEKDIRGIFDNLKEFDGISAKAVMFFISILDDFMGIEETSLKKYFTNQNIKNFKIQHVPFLRYQIDNYIDNIKILKWSSKEGGN